MYLVTMYKAFLAAVLLAIMVHQCIIREDTTVRRLSPIYVYVSCSEEVSEFPSDPFAAQIRKQFSEGADKQTVVTQQLVVGREHLSLKVEPKSKTMLLEEVENLHQVACVRFMNSR